MKLFWSSLYGALLSTQLLCTSVAAQSVMATPPIPIGVQSNFKTLKATFNATTPNTKRDLSADAVMLANTTGRYFVATSISCTIDYGTTGANGLDTGSLAASTWYYEYVIWNGTTVACLGSLSATAPTMPSGYTFKARTSAVITDGSVHFLRTLQYGRRAQYVVGTNPSTPLKISSGVVGTYSDLTPTYANVATGGFVPTTAGRIFLTFNNCNSGTGSASAFLASPNGSYGGMTTANSPAFEGTNNAAGFCEAWSWEMTLESTNISLATSAANASLYVNGWEDNL